MYPKKLATLKQLRTRFKAKHEKGVGTPFPRVPAPLHPDNIMQKYTWFSHAVKTSFGKRSSPLNTCVVSHFQLAVSRRNEQAVVLMLRLWQVDYTSGCQPVLYWCTL